MLALKRSGGWDIVVEWVSTPEPDSKRSRLERGLQIDPFSSFSVAASQLAESGVYFTNFSVPVLRIRIRDPVPFCHLDPGSGMGKKSGSGSGTNKPDHISLSGPKQHLKFQIRRCQPTR
jgi:hypothetical protein